MSNKYKKTDAVPFSGRSAPEMGKTEVEKMEAELNELRHCLEQNVEYRTEHLLRRMALLESCNAALCEKLALAYKELAALKLPPPHTLTANDTGAKSRNAKLYVMNNRTQGQIRSSAQDKWGEYAIVS